MSFCIYVTVVRIFETAKGSLESSFEQPNNKQDKTQKRPAVFRFIVSKIQ